MGGSGSGKSTVGLLVTRLYDPDSGSISIGDVDIKDLCPQWLRRQIAVVSQEPVLFNMSILENIRYGCPNASEEDVRRAAMKANAFHFIEAFPDGFQTLVGERGAQLSGGQKQRIAIARAILKDPPLIILDEATSALDAESEHLVQQAIDRMSEHRSILSIAHRLSTIRAADRVVLLQRGVVLESGTFEELMSNPLKGQNFKALVHRQLEA